MFTLSTTGKPAECSGIVPVAVDRQMVRTAMNEQQQIPELKFSSDNACCDNFGTWVTANQHVVRGDGLVSLIH